MLTAETNLLKEIRANLPKLDKNTKLYVLGVVEGFVLAKEREEKIRAKEKAKENVL